jgi:hypothetical protein
VAKREVEILESDQPGRISAVLERRYRFYVDTRTMTNKTVEMLDGEGDAALTVGDRVQIDIWNAFQRLYDEKS